MSQALPDLLRPGLGVVFVGTAAGRYSASVGAYYARAGNLLWPTLHRLGLLPRELKPHESTELLSFAIALTD